MKSLGAARSLETLGAGGDFAAAALVAASRRLASPFAGPGVTGGANLEEGAGLCGRLAGQNWRSSRLSSCPVVVQFERILSRRSWTWRLRSSSFFLSQLTFSS